MSKYGQKIDLYLARSLGQLNTLVEKGSSISSNARTLANSSQKLFNEGERLYLDGDEEKSYVFYMRFLEIVSKVKKSSDYKKDQVSPNKSLVICDYKFYDSLIGNKAVGNALSKAEQLGSNLKTRYDELEAIEVSKKLKSAEAKGVDKDQLTPSLDDVLNEERKTNGSENAVTSVLKTKKFVDASAPPGGITVESVFRLMGDSKVCLVLMDVRSLEDFSKSHVKSISCISVPAECLKPGTTVSQIDKSLPLESKQLWRSRDTVDQIILMDWKGSASKLDPRSSTACLRDALTKWDVNTELRNEPLILEGGYEEWLMCYPTHTTNCHVTPPISPTSSSAVPSLDSIDYDMDIDFSEFSVSQQKKNQPKEAIVESKVAVDSSSTNINVKSDADKKPPKEVFQPESSPLDRSQIIPSIDRSTKPMSTPLRMNNSVDSPSVKQNGDISRLSNKLNEYEVKDTGSSRNADNASAAYRSRSDAAQPPSTDRTKKPSERKKISNQENGNQKTRLEKELQDVIILQEKKAIEAQALADLMRKKKKIEEELAALTLRKDTELKGSVTTNVLYDSTSSDDEDASLLMRSNGRPLENNQAHAWTKASTNEERPMEDAYLQKKLELNNAEHHRLEEQKKRQEAELEENIKAEQKKLESQAKARREAEAAEKHLKLAEEKKNQEFLLAENEKKLEAERKSEMEEHERRKHEAVADQKQKEEAESKKLEDEQLAKEKDVERRKREIPASENRQKDEQVRQLRIDEVDINKHQPTDVDRQLPVKWEKRLDPKTGKYFYINHETKSTHWELPQHDSIPASSYKIPLKTDAAPQTSFGGGLSRSHSSPNIAKLMQDSNDQRTSMVSQQKPQPLADRSTKPQSSQRIPIQTEVSAAKVRNLQPTWGSVGRGLTGLRNLGNTCYMNSTVQCLSNTVPLTLYFLSNSYINDLNRENNDGYRGQVADEYAVLVKALWSGQYRSVVPKDFRTVSCLMNSMFASSQHQDSQELLMYLMSALSEGLNKVRMKPTLPPLETDNMDEEKASDLVWNHLRIKEDSIFVDLFQGLYKSTVMCLHCNKKSVKFDSFMYLTLPIPSPTRCNLADSLLHFSKESKLTGDSRWDCPQCRCKRDATVRLVIWRLPPILIIVLKRFHYDGIWRDKITTQVDFPLEDLDMSRYISGPKKRPVYNLYAVSNHYGMLDGGHYTAACRSPTDSKWYKYDDHEVHEMSSSDIKSSAAYILFYTSMKNDTIRL